VVDADRIVVLRDGFVEAVGKHAELLAQGGYYAQLFARHARGAGVEPIGALPDAEGHAPSSAANDRALDGMPPRLVAGRA
jgi:hypothetical protein